MEFYDFEKHYIKSLYLKSMHTTFEIILKLQN